VARRKSVLIVEDDEPFRRLVTVSLKFAGFDVREAGTGLDALLVVDRDPPDIVTLDLLLPGIDGLAVRAQIAADATTRQIPVVIVTGSDLDLSGVDSACILRKPVDADDVVRAVDRCLRAGSPAAGV
jgi:two-component system response regulator MprA